MIEGKCLESNPPPNLIVGWGWEVSWIKALMGMFLRCVQPTSTSRLVKGVLYVVFEVKIGPDLARWRKKLSIIYFSATPFYLSKKGIEYNHRQDTSPSVGGVKSSDHVLLRAEFGICANWDYHQCTSSCVSHWLGRPDAAGLRKVTRGPQVWWVESKLR